MEKNLKRTFGFLLSYMMIVIPVIYVISAVFDNPIITVLGILLTCTLTMVVWFR